MNRFTLRLPDDLRADLKPGYGWCEIAERLAAYEDTGLEPEEVEACKVALMGKSLAGIKEIEGISVERMKDLAKAEAEGRLLVLPCKVGDTVYLPATDDWDDILSYEVVEMGIDRDGPYFVINDEDHDHIPMEEMGKSVFLTREEAKKALAAMDRVKKEASE